MQKYKWLVYDTEVINGQSVSKNMSGSIAIPKHEWLKDHVK